ncbi:unnamed protein product [Closterium sp. NIES-64]|nr:unnamed protein product [Closterium sp. NIES-65]CAI5968664.1 unnamed protein product [Closterium sp. NIES-65]CAI5980311.1 unnamed protein product [Closterium sp. NIES-64]CAI6011303.1 unnamed protein product [Closterium sp. NIES-65]
MKVLRAFLLLLCALAVAHLAAAAEFNPALATLAASPDDSLLATGKALADDASEDADVLITNRALAEEGEESRHNGAVRVLTEVDLLSLLAEGDAYADVADSRRSLKKRGKKCKKGKKGKKCWKGKKGKKNGGAVAAPGGAGAAPGGAAPEGAAPEGAAPGGADAGGGSGAAARSMAEVDMPSQIEEGDADADVTDIRRSLKKKGKKCKKGKKGKKCRKGKKGKKNGGAVAAPGGAGAAPGGAAPEGAAPEGAAPGGADAGGGSGAAARSMAEVDMPSQIEEGDADADVADIRRSLKKKGKKCKKGKKGKKCKKGQKGKKCWKGKKGKEPKKGMDGPPAAAGADSAAPSGGEEAGSDGAAARSMAEVDLPSPLAEGDEDADGDADVADVPYSGSSRTRPLSPPSTSPSPIPPSSPSSAAPSPSPPARSYSPRSPLSNSPFEARPTTIKSTTGTSLHSLTLGRGAWRFDKSSCVAAPLSRSITSLTLRANDARGPNLKALAEFTPQLHEFTFYEPESLAYGVVSGPVYLKLDFPRIRRLTFRFVHDELKLRLSLPPAFTSFHASAKTLILNCSSASPLVLDQLFLFGKTRLHISSFAVGSVRALYLNGPIRFYPTWPNPYILKKRQGFGMYSEMPPPPFPWADWLRALAPTTEVLIARHDIRLDSCGVAGPRLQSLAIVVECDCARAKAVPGEVTLEDAVRTDASYSVREKRREEYWGRMREQRLEEDRQDEERMSGKYTTRFHTGPFGNQVASGSKIDNDTEYDYEPNEDERWESSYEEYATKYSLEPPLIEDLKFVFFPTSRRADANLLGALQAAYPSVEMYCAEGSSWY